MSDLRLVTYCGLYCGLCSQKCRIPKNAQALSVFRAKNTRAVG